MAISRGKVYKSQWKTKDGTPRESDTYHYRVAINNHRYTGDTGESTETKAKAWLRKYIAEVLTIETPKQLVQAHRTVLAGKSDFAIEHAFDAFLKVPRKRTMGEKRESLARRQWEDFTAYMKHYHPDATRMIDVTADMAEAYVTYLRRHGRYIKAVKYRRKNGRKTLSYTPATDKNGDLHVSDNTANVYLITCRAVFEHLKDKLGLPENPFGKCSPVKVRQSKRTVYEEELSTQILARVTGILKDLFITGFSTGMDEQSICLLRRDSIRLDDGPGWITKTTRAKTGAALEFPLMPDFRDHLRAAMADNDADSQFVYPELAQMYLTNPTGISYRVKQLLGELAQTTVESFPGRTRKVSVLDVHSMRHTFCYRAGRYGIDLGTLQGWVGHMTTDMTRHYMTHAKREDKVKAMEVMHTASHPDTPCSKEGGKTEEGTNQDPENEVLKKLREMPEDKVVEALKALSEDTRAALIAALLKS